MNFICKRISGGRFCEKGIAKRDTLLKPGCGENNKTHTKMRKNVREFYKNEHYVRKCAVCHFYALKCNFYAVIHGKLSNPQSVIFGYGDEKDEEYKELMNNKNHEYLRHIKSFRNLDASNYRRMLAFIESDSYQICIMGHSCGVTDRTLLSTHFEHPNCVSIKPYYYRKEDGTDNYRELVQDIARNIADPRLMRDLVVGKERCEALGKE